MNNHMMKDQHSEYKRYIDQWEDCNYFGEIITIAERTNDVCQYLTKLGADYLIDLLYIDHETQAFVYNAYIAEIRADEVGSEEFNNGFGILFLEKKRPIHVVEIYFNLRPQAIDWRMHREQFVIKIDNDHINGLEYDNVAVTHNVYPFAKTAFNEVMTIENQMSLF